MGIVFLGDSISSAGNVDSSNPAYAQNMSTSALPKSEELPVTNGWKLPAATEGLNAT